MGFPAVESRRSEHSSETCNLSHSRDDLSLLLIGRPVDVTALAYDLEVRRAVPNDKLGTSSDASGVASPQSLAVVVYDQVAVFLEDQDEALAGAVAGCRSDRGAVLVSDDVAIGLEDDADTVHEGDDVAVRGAGDLEVGKLEDVRS